MNSSSEFIMILKSIFVAVSVGSIVIYLILAISYSKIFKANNEKGWKGYVPIVNIWTLMKISGMNPLSIFLLIIPIVNLFVLALLSVKLANKLGRGAGFAVGLLFLPFIFYPILALSLKVEKKEKKKIKEEEKEKSIFCPVCGTELKNGETKCYVCDAEIKENTETEKIEDKKDTVETNLDNNVTDEFAIQSNKENNNEYETNLIDNNFENKEENNMGYDFNNSSNYNEESNSDYNFDNTFNYNEENIIDNTSYINNLDNNYSSNENSFNASNENINKKFYHNPLDTDFDDLFLRNKNENKKVIDIKKDEEEFNDMVSNYNFDSKELNVTDLGSIDVPKTHTYKDDIEEAMEVETNYKNLAEQKPKYKSSTRTLDEILRINQNLYTKNPQIIENKPNIVDKNDNIDDEIDEEDLIKKIKLLNKQMEKSRIEFNEEKSKVKVCKVCGTTIPSYSKTCLLCGSEVEDD